MLTQYSWVFSQWLIPLALTHSSSPLRILIFHSSLACLPASCLTPFCAEPTHTLHPRALSLSPSPFFSFLVVGRVVLLLLFKKRAECSNERRPNAPKWLNMYRNEEFSPYIKMGKEEEEEPYVPSSSTSSSSRTTTKHWLETMNKKRVSERERCRSSDILRKDISFHSMLLCWLRNCRCRCEFRFSEHFTQDPRVDTAVL